MILAHTPVIRNIFTCELFCFLIVRQQFCQTEKRYERQQDRNCPGISSVAGVVPILSILPHFLPQGSREHNNNNA